jgi:hypothetical protein
VLFDRRGDKARGVVMVFDIVMLNLENIHYKVGFSEEIL